MIRGDEDGRKAVAEATRERVILRAFPKIVQAIYDQAKSSVLKEKDAQIHNPSAIARGDNAPAVVEVSAADALFELQKRRMTTDSTD